MREAANVAPDAEALKEKMDDPLTKMKTCCFTGHRRISKELYPRLRSRLLEEIRQLADKGVCRFACGGALGFDTLAAQAVLELRRTIPVIRLLLVLPCLDQTHGWSERNAAVYESIREQADEVVYTGERYSAGCMQRRNRALVDSSSRCICYLNSDRGGTRYTVNYALKKGIPVLNLAESRSDVTASSNCQ